LRPLIIKRAGPREGKPYRFNYLMSILSIIFGQLRESRVLQTYRLVMGRPHSGVFWGLPIQQRLERHEAARRLYPRGQTLMTWSQIAHTCKEPTTNHSRSKSCRPARRSLTPVPHDPNHRACRSCVPGKPGADAVNAQFDRVLNALEKQLPAFGTHLETARADVLAFTGFPREI